MHEENKFSYRPLAGGNDAEWHFALGLDDVAKAGSYVVRLFHRDLQSLGIETNECDKEHYTFAHLLVSESAATGKQQTVRTIGQTLFLTICATNEVKALTRTCELTPQGAEWTPWSNIAAHNSAVATVSLKWGADSSINNYTTAGTYSIAGERLNANDGLPIANSNPGHTIHARLTVLDSSIAGTGDSHDKCVTQLLTLSNRTGGDGDVYIRTGRAHSTNVLAGGTGWEPWGKLQQNIEVGQVTSLNSFTGNGVYSGVYTNGSTFFETFVMVVINNYAVAGATGQVRSISQFKYALNVDGTFSYKTRTGQGNSIEWGSWVDLGAATTTDIQDGAITAQKLSSDVREKVEKVPSLEKNAAKEKNALVNGDTIVGLAREVYSRQGKVDTTTFLKRTTAGGTSVSDGVATLKQIGGNIVKNNAGRFYASNTNSTLTNLANGIYKYYKNNSVQTYLMHEVDGFVDNHVYYVWYYNYTNVSNVPRVSLAYSYNTGRLFNLKTTSVNSWELLSKQMKLVKGDIDIRQTSTWWPLGSGDGNAGDYCYFTEPTYIDLTDMFGAGNEPTKEECDRMFACMGALPQGLTVAQPTGLKSIGYNQWNPANVLLNKSIVENAIEDDVADRHIAIVECLPCKTGTGENNGYVIGYGEGDTWSDEGIEVYLTPLNPLEVDGELYLQKLDKEATYGTYVPQIKGYLLVVTPTTDKLCAHFHWSGDRAATDYEPYVESSVALPVIPEMSEWGLAGIQASGIQDSVNLEKNTYTKRIDCLDLGNINYQYYSPSETYPYGFFAASIKNARFSKTNALMCEKYAHGSFAVDKAIMANTANNSTFYIIDGSYTDAVSLKNALEGVKLYYEIIPQEYPIVTKVAPNYIGSDYGVEEFTGSKVPLAANILFYMRSLVSETRNFLDRLMTGLGTSDATVVADKIIAAVNQHGEVAEIEEVIE